MAGLSDIHGIKRHSHLGYQLRPGRECAEPPAIISNVTNRSQVSRRVRINVAIDKIIAPDCQKDIPTAAHGSRWSSLAHRGGKMQGRGLALRPNIRLIGRRVLFWLEPAPPAGSWMHHVNEMAAPPKPVANLTRDG